MCGHSSANASQHYAGSKGTSTTSSRRGGPARTTPERSLPSRRDSFSPTHEAISRQRTITPPRNATKLAAAAEATQALARRHATFQRADERAQRLLALRRSLRSRRHPSAFAPACMAEDRAALIHQMDLEDAKAAAKQTDVEKPAQQKKKQVVLPKGPDPCVDRVKEIDAKYARKTASRFPSTQNYVTGPKWAQ